jgi:hypothetical protein
MKIAKATQKDIDVAGNMMSVLSQLDRGDYPVVEKTEDRPDYFDPESFEHLKHFYNLFANSLEDAPNWYGRVIGGMCYVIMFDKNEIIDPASETLDLHPKFQCMLNERDEALAINAELLTTLENLKDAVEFAPLGLKGLKALETAKSTIIKAKGGAA